jgi:hypothetical protein
MAQWFTTMFPVKFAIICGVFHTQDEGCFAADDVLCADPTVYAEATSRREPSERAAGDEQRKGFNKIKDQMIKELIGILTNYWEFIRYNNI